MSAVLHQGDCLDVMRGVSLEQFAIIAPTGQIEHANHKTANPATPPGATP